MEDNSSNNKRIAKNTIILYIKLILSIIIGLYTSRVVLQSLGASDYGLYNVVGGLVAMMNIVATSMVATSYRYISVELGKGKIISINRVYNTLYVVHITLALLLIIVGETLGLWYVNNYLNVVSEKLADSRFILHFSLLTTAISVVGVPQQGLIIAREKFQFTAILEIAGLLFKLLCVIWLAQYPGNRLRAFTVIMSMYAIGLRLGYYFYCKIKDQEIIKWNFNRCWKDYKEIFLFSWWMLIGAVACVGRVQGANMIINLFFGTTLNAAFGLAGQVNNYVTMFVKNLTHATNPQIMKSLGAGDEDRSIRLVYAISRYSFLVMLVPVIPLVYCLKQVLVIWLGNPPEYTDVFTVLLLINGLIACLSSGFDASIQATGKVKVNQIGYAIINLSLLPIIFVLYKLGLPPQTNMIVMIVLTIATLIFQCFVIKNLTSFKLKEYFKHTVRPSVTAGIVAAVPMYFLRILFANSILAGLGYIIVAVIWTLVIVYLLGLSPSERIAIKNFIKSKICKKSTI